MPKKANNHKPEKFVLSLGGSLISTKDGVREAYLKSFASFIREKIAENHDRQFFITVGGGYLARHYRDALKYILKNEAGMDDLDLIGVAVTHLNARLVRALFDELAPKEIITNYDNLPVFSERVIIGAGWEPGCSTDCDAVYFAESYNVSRIYNLSVIDGVALEDPAKHPDAKPVPKLSWQDFRGIVGDAWSPGKSAPFDPVASKHAEAAGISVVVLNGNDFKNLDAAMKGEKFQGTLIE